MERGLDFISFGDEDDKDLDIKDKLQEDKDRVKKKRKRSSREEDGARESRESTDGSPSSKVLSVDLLSATAKSAPWTGASEFNYYSNGVLLIEILSREVQDFVAYISPTDEETRMRDFAVERFRKAALKTFAGGDLQVFGSYHTKLFLPTSDLDLVVQAPGFSEIDALSKFGSCLLEEKICAKEGYTEIRNTKVPIIKCTEAVSGYQVDISFNSNSGPSAVHTVAKYLSDPKLGPAVKPLMYVLKQYLHQLNLNEPYSGGLGSFGLLLMVVHFLKRHPLLSLAQPRVIDPFRNVGVLLMEILEFYGKIFNNNEVALFFDPKTGDAGFVSKVDCYRYYPSLQPRFGKQSPLTIIDPNDVENDVTRASFNYNQVRQAFSNAYSVLSYVQAIYYARLQDCQQDQRASVPPTPVSQLGLILTICPKHLASRMKTKATLKRLEMVDFNLDKLNSLPKDADSSLDSEDDRSDRRKRQPSRKKARISSKVDDRPDTRFVSAESFSEG